MDIELRINGMVSFGRINDLFHLQSEHDCVSYNVRLLTFVRAGACSIASRVGPTIIIIVLTKPL